MSEEPLRVSQSRDIPKKQSLPRDPSKHIIPAVGSKVCKYCLHWAIWIPRDLLKSKASADGHEAAGTGLPRVHGGPIQAFV